MAWITYSRCSEGLDCLNTYKAECAAWCYDRVEDGKFGDQKYLDTWPDRYPSLKIIEHKGFNLAIWNVNGYMMRVKTSVVTIDDDPLVFYHFASTQLLPDGTVRAPTSSRGGRSKAVLLENVIKPYERMLEQERRRLQERFPALAAAKSDIRYPAANTTGN